MKKPSILLTSKWPESVEARASELFDVTFNPEDRPMNRGQMRVALETHDAVLATVTDDVKCGDVYEFETNGEDTRQLWCWI